MTLVSLRLPSAVPQRRAFCKPAAHVRRLYSFYCRRGARCVLEAENVNKTKRRNVVRDAQRASVSAAGGFIGTEGRILISSFIYCRLTWWSVCSELRFQNTLSSKSPHFEKTTQKISTTVPACRWVGLEAQTRCLSLCLASAHFTRSHQVPAGSASRLHRGRAVGEGEGPVVMKTAGVTQTL